MKKYQEALRTLVALAGDYNQPSLIAIEIENANAILQELIDDYERLQKIANLTESEYAKYVISGELPNE